MNVLNGAAITFLGLFVESLALAQEPSVEITSFRYVSRTRAAELCGKTHNATSFPVFVKAVVDESSDVPGTYNMVVGPEGVFCTMVVTYRGTATATIWGQASGVKAQAEFLEQR